MAPAVSSGCKPSRRSRPSRRYEVVDGYVEPGASGTDDNRKVFRRILEAVLAPSSNVDAVLVLVYQTSRFMRNDALRKNGIRVTSICKETSDDPMGQFIEGILS
jgi:site-specific DNA recombinase